MEMKDDGDELARDISKLLALIKKIIKSEKALDLNKILDAKGKDVQVNLCFFTFLPISAEEFEEFASQLEGELAERERPLAFELNPSDLEFLKRNGIEF